MIDKTTFAAEMTILQNRFPGGRDMTAETIARYLDYLGPQLNTTQFTRAAREIFNHDTFWPAPARFLEVLQGGSSKELADAAWGEVLRLAQRGEYPPLDTLDAATRAALKVVPMREIQYADSEAKLARLKREFTAAHATANTNHVSSDAPALMAARPELTR